MCHVKNLVMSKSEHSLGKAIGFPVRLTFEACDQLGMRPGRGFEASGLGDDQVIQHIEAGAEPVLTERMACIGQETLGPTTMVRATVRPGVQVNLTKWSCCQVPGWSSGRCAATFSAVASRNTLGSASKPTAQTAA
ncbi:hypothetical protein [Mesorhizobium shangrilense]|uniref:Uncharacterized protein n=1 Tax=Mesorhizobium shangrilense TaxID=460060 RepID=A0ABV2DG09_9HYPH